MKFFRENITRRKIMFFLAFSVLALITQRVNFSAIVGANSQFFTLFQFFAPVAGIFLGPVFGIFAVLLAEIANIVLQGTSLTALTMLRLIPILFATYYFGAKDKKRLGIVIPALSILLFLLHPVGRTVWFFTLYWTIPILPLVFPKSLGRVLFLRSLGSTFTAHAVGTALWIWTVPMTAGQWIGLIPVVAYERLLFAAGITVTFLAFNALLAMLDERWTAGAVFVDRKYVPGRIL
jgi:hypothetical protein